MEFTSTGYACLMNKQKLGFENVGVRFFSNDRKTMEMKVEIISKQKIKPESPTPQHLRTYKLSSLDQLNPHHYIPLVYFYQNNRSDKPSNFSILEKLQRLKQSLSQTLALFYPLAGKLKDNLHIECNDDGVYYVDAGVSCNLLDFLGQSNNKLISHLLPFHPSAMELESETFIAMIQVNIFECGGIAIGIYTSHKLIDGPSHFNFLKAWAATARGSSEQICPNFISSSLFLPSPAMREQDASLLFWPSGVKRGSQVTRRFRLDASALTALRAKATASNPSRVMSVTGLLWKCALGAFRVRSGYQRPSVLTIPVNTRPKLFPPLSPYSIGNIYWTTVAQSLPDADAELPSLASLVRSIKNAIARIDSDFVAEMTGEAGPGKVHERWKELEKLYSDNNPDSCSVTSLCNGGLYEADFGWGKPLWSSIGFPDPDFPAVNNLVVLFDTRSGDGIEAFVTMDEQDMITFEQHPELLAFASLNSNPFE